MKYLRKIVGLVIAVVFIASVIIGFGIIFSVKNVNISLLSYAYPEREAMTEEESRAADKVIDDFKQEILSGYRGTLLSFVDGSELSARFKNTNYIVESFEKIYPCTINLVIKERRETFKIKVAGDKYDIYDSYGTLMRSGVSEEDSLNNIDNAPNISVVVGNKSEISVVAEMASAFAEEFGALRSIVEAIEISSTTNHLFFKFNCGITLRINEYGKLTKEKLRAAHEKFMQLGGEEKLSGTLVVSAGSNGEVVAGRYAD